MSTSSPGNSGKMLLLGKEIDFLLFGSLGPPSTFHPQEPEFVWFQSVQRFDNLRDHPHRKSPGGTLPGDVALLEMSVLILSTHNTNSWKPSAALRIIE